MCIETRTLSAERSTNGFSCSARGRLHGRQTKWATNKLRPYWATRLAQLGNMSKNEQPFSVGVGELGRGQFGLGFGEVGVGRRFYAESVNSVETIATTTCSNDINSNVIFLTY